MVKEKKYRVKIIQHAEKTVIVDAESSADAIKFVSEQFGDGDILFDDADWDDMEYRAMQKK